MSGLQFLISCKIKGNLYDHCRHCRGVFVNDVSCFPLTELVVTASANEQDQILRSH